MTEPTPGPYMVHGTAIMAQGQTDTFDGPVWGTIGWVEVLEVTDGEGRTWRAAGDMEANAKQFAAAPETRAQRDELLVASEAMIRCLGIMTSEDFSLGADKPCREQLAAAIARVRAQS